MLGHEVTTLFCIEYAMLVGSRLAAAERLQALEKTIATAVAYQTALLAALEDFQPFLSQQAAE